MTTKRRYYSKYAMDRRATRRTQDADDDKFYAEQARKRREAEEVAQAEAASNGEQAAKKGGAAKPLTRCAAGRDGECGHAQCPQLRDNEPKANGRHCPLDSNNDESAMQHD